MRLAVVDTGPECPVPVPGTDLLLNVSEAKPAARWVLARRSVPRSPVARGLVSEPVDGAGGADPQDPPPAAIQKRVPANPLDFTVQYLGPTQGYATVLSVTGLNPAMALGIALCAIARKWEFGAAAGGCRPSRHWSDSQR